MRAGPGRCFARAPLRSGRPGGPCLEPFKGKSTPNDSTNCSPPPSSKRASAKASNVDRAKFSPPRRFRPTSVFDVVFPPKDELPRAMFSPPPA